MATLEELVIQLTLEAGQLNKQIKASTSALSSSSKQMTDAVEQFSKRGTKSLTSFQSAMSTMAGFVGGQFIISAFSRLTNVTQEFAVASVSAASDAQETYQKFGVVFRDVSQEAEAAALSLANNFGLAESQAKSFLANTGDLLSGFGFGSKMALELSTAVNELAVDLASFTNFSGGAKGASDALTKALLGEREAIKSLGISILEDDVKARVQQLEAMGQVEGMTERQKKAFATLQLATEQSKNAIGDFARSSESFANQSRIVNARLTTLLETIGGVILKNEAFQKSIKFVITGFEDSTKAVKDNNSAFDEFITETLATFVKALGITFEGIHAIAAGLGTLPAILATTAGYFRAARESLRAFAHNEDAWAAWTTNVEKANSILVENFSEGMFAKLADRFAEFQQDITDTEVEAIKERGPLLAEATAEASKLVEDAKLAARSEAIEKEKKMIDDIYGYENKSMEEQHQLDRQIEIEALKSDSEFRKKRLGQAGDMFGNLSALSKTSNKQLFEIGKAAAMAQAIINTSLAATRALAEGGPFLGPFLAASVVAAGGVQIAQIASQQFKAAKGIDEVPGIGSQDQFPALLAPGERVVPRETNADLKQFLSNMQQGGGGGVAGVEIQLSMTDDLMDFVETKLVERGLISTSIQG